MPAIKVVHVINDLLLGGSQTMLCKLVEHSKGSGVTHSVVVLMDGGHNWDRLKGAGIEVESLGFPRGSATPRLAWRVIQAIRRQRPDVVQGWMYHANVAATIGTTTRRQHTPLVWGIRHTVLDIRKERLGTRVMIHAGRALGRYSRAIVYCSHRSASQHERLGYPADKSLVIPNGFDCDAFRPDPSARSALTAALDIAPGAVIIGMAARYHPMKDHRNLIRAAAHLRRAGAAIHLVMAGRGVEPHNGELVADIEQAGLAGHVSLLGPRQDMPSILAGLDVVALPSAWGEAFPNVLGEAMACGVPCIATDVGDSHCIVGDCGRVVPPQDTPALAQALGELVEVGVEGRRRLGSEARGRILRNFTMPAVARRYEALYQALASRPPDEHPVRLGQGTSACS
jgi:glycosyltransferase involved in cell wall biosynthesis